MFYDLIIILKSNHTFLNAFRKFSDKNAYNTGLTHELEYASTCENICNAIVIWDVS